MRGAADDPPGCAAPQPPGAAPRFAMPRGACDTHTHVFGPYDAFPLAAERPYSPPAAPLGALQAHLDALSLERVVIVQPSVYSTDNRATLAAATAFGARARAVVVIDPAEPDETLLAMHAAGARGMRLNLLFDASATLEGLPHLAARLAPLGWHIQILADVSRLDDIWPTLAALPVPVVFDHFGHCAMPLGVRTAGFGQLLKLVESGKAWVKLSAPYRVSHPPYADMNDAAQRLVRANPERLVWASDWPHPMCPGPMPGDTQLLDLLEDWVPDAAARTAILRDNPARLYGFEALAP